MWPLYCMNLYFSLQINKCIWYLAKFKCCWCLSAPNQQIALRLGRIERKHLENCSYEVCIWTNWLPDMKGIKWRSSNKGSIGAFDLPASKYPAGPRTLSFCFYFLCLFCDHLLLSFTAQSQRGNLLRMAPIG